MRSMCRSSYPRRHAGAEDATSMAPGLSEAMLNEAYIAFVSGNDFGGLSANNLRISFACSPMIR